MAKISARGDRERRRYTHPDGRVMVHTVNGRLLRKVTPTSGYTLAASKVSPEQADEQARRGGYTR